MRSIRKILMLACLTLMLNHPNGHAERIVRVSAEGHLELEDGTLVSLAGIDVSEEAIRLYPAIFAGHEVKIQKTRVSSVGNKSDLPVQAVPAYIYVEVPVIHFPYEGEGREETEKLSANELLLSLGGARVMAEMEFDKKEDFLAVEAEARRTGQGIWSYAGEETR